MWDHPCDEWYKKLYLVRSHCRLLPGGLLVERPLWNDCTQEEKAKKVKQASQPVKEKEKKKKPSTKSSKASSSAASAVTTTGSLNKLVLGGGLKPGAVLPAR